MDKPTSSSLPHLPGLRRVATLSLDGRPGPIEERLGRRRLRVIAPATSEGRRLLDAGAVEFTGPDGSLLGKLTLAEARRRLHARLARGVSPAADRSARRILESCRRSLRSGSGPRQD